MLLLLAFGPGFFTAAAVILWPLAHHVFQCHEQNCAPLKTKRKNMQRKKHLNLHNFRFTSRLQLSTPRQLWSYAAARFAASCDAKGRQQSAAMGWLLSLLLAFKVLHVAGASS